MTGGTNRSLEDLLRDRLAEVDNIEPPDPEFEFRALRAGRERLKRRQAWTRGLVGAAAAVVIGALAIPSLGRLNVGGSAASSAGSGVAGASAPEASSGTGAGQDLKGPDAAPGGEGQQTPGVVGGSEPTDPAGTQLKVELQRTYASVFTALEQRTVSVNGVATQQIVVHLTAEEPGAMAAARQAYPSGPHVVFAQSAYSLLACRQRASTIETDVLYLRDRGITLLSTQCNVDGRVAIQARGLPSDRDFLLSKYGDTVVVTVVQGP